MNKQKNPKVAREAWRKYLNYYPYLLAYNLNETYPYKKLADLWGALARTEIKI